MNEMWRNQSIYGSENLKCYNTEVPKNIMDVYLSSCISGENNSFSVEKLHKIHSCYRSYLTTTTLFTKNVGYCTNLMQILKCKTRFYSVGELWCFHYLFLKPTTDLSLKAIKKHKNWKFPNVKKHQTIFVFTSFLLRLPCCKTDA